MTIEKNLEAGNDIDSRCLKCKDVTNHTIIAMADGEVAKVECNVCKAKHKYRAPKPEKVPGAKKKTTRAPSSAKANKAEALFESLIEGRDQAKAISYAMTASFKEGDLIDHTTFGLGVVMGTTLPNKMEVQFRPGSKILICVLAPAKR